MADSPKEGEAAQALFCAIADLLGERTTKKEFVISKYPTYKVFKKTYSKIITIHLLEWILLKFHLDR